MQIVSLQRHQLQQAAEVIARAFYDYPMFTFYFPDPKRRSRNLPWYLRQVLNCAFDFGDVLTTPDLDGVIFTLPPGHNHMSLWEYITHGFVGTPLRIGLRNYARSMACEEFVGETQKRLMAGTPHTYLWGLAVDPDKQIKGVGKALMQPVLAKADADGMPIYLETHNPRNVGYYERYGFTLLDAPVFQKYEMQIWCMVRKAGSTS